MEEEKEKTLPKWPAHLIGIALGILTFGGVSTWGAEPDAAGFLGFVVYGLTLMVTRGGLLGQALAVGVFLFYGGPLIGGMVIGGKVGSVFMGILGIIVTVFLVMGVFTSNSRSSEGRASSVDFDGDG